MLDQMAHKHTNTTGKTSHSSALTGEENPRKHGREDPKLSSTPGDKKYDAWPDDWCEPALELLVDVQRGPQNSSIVLAKLFVRMWFHWRGPVVRPDICQTDHVTIFREFLKPLPGS
jgi:hypothetical protein